ncbi:MAG: nucleotidyltransferase family protein [Pseudomonadales bacterium]|nr:nucleotidyltransferase family protein [Pseudomonadales bacterium]
MKAMILAAGKGERMRPLTLTTPKPLLTAGGRPLIGHHLVRLQQAGFREVVINHAWLGEQIVETLGQGQDYGLQLHYSAEDEPLETAGGIRQALPQLASADSPWFLVINGDIWCDLDLGLLTPPHDASARALVVLVDNPPHNPDGDFHLAADGHVHADGTPQLTFAGISLLHRDLLADLPTGHRPLAPLLRQAMAAGQVYGWHHRGHWADIGTPQRLAELDRLLNQQEPSQP